jgi:16S rRNA G527 N7-methylase RsmG
VRLLELEEVDVFEGRFDELAGEPGAHNFDLAVSRAAARPPQIVKQAEGFLVPDGRLLVYTTQDLVIKGVGNVYPYLVPGSKVPSVIWEVTY